jgi:hypothetical protein
MATSHLKSTAITNLDAVPASRATSGEGAKGYMEEVTGYVTVLAADAAGTTYQLVRIPSNAKVKRVFLVSQAQGAGKVNVGLYYSTALNDGTPSDKASALTEVDADLFATDVDLASAVATDVTNESGTYTIDKWNQPIWQAAGLSADPGGFFDVSLTVHTTDVTTGTGKAGVSVTFVP